MAIRYSDICKVLEWYISSLMIWNLHYNNGGKNIYSFWYATFQKTWKPTGDYGRVLFDFNKYRTYGKEMKKNKLKAANSTQ